MPMTNEDILRDIERKILWLSCWTVHNANHLRDNPDGLKVGGHQASCASMVSLMTALYFSVLKPEDRIAVKPHASPVFHAIQYLFGHQIREKLEAFRGFGGAQSYPSRTKDVDDVDFSTGSVGLGVAITAFSSLIQDYIRAKPWADSTRREGRMIALVGDAELDEGNVFECLQEGWKQGLRNTWWIIDYNRQSLDGVVREGLYDRLEGVFKAFGWDVVTLKYGALQRAAFAEPGGDRLKNWIDTCPNSLYSALTYQGGAAWRKRLMDDIGDQGAVSALIDSRSDSQLAELMVNLGGHCLETLSDAFSGIDHDRPVAFIAYTIKGWGTPLAGHKDNHSGLMTVKQMAAFRSDMGVREGHEWDRFEGLAADRNRVEDFLARVPFNARGRRRLSADALPVPELTPLSDKSISTQAAFGKYLDQLAKGTSPLAERVVTTSPDVTVSTNLGPWVNRRHLFSREEIADTFREERVPSAQKWQFRPDGQHIELGIAEMNLFLLLGAAGLSHQIFGERLLPVGTLYDPFISRGLDALNYACYQDARFLLAATPAGVTLAPEGGAHQSVATPLIGMSQDGLASFEPAFTDELAAIMEWSFDFMQRDGAADPHPRTWLPDGKGGAVYLRLTTRALEQPARVMTSALRQDILDGAYWMRPPGANADLVIVYQGTVATEAIEAAGRIGGDRRDIGVLAVTSADRLAAGFQAVRRARMTGVDGGACHIDRLLQRVPPHATLITVIDGHPASLSWLGGVRGHRVVPLGVEHFGQTGRIDDLYRHHGIDADAIVRAAEMLTPGRPIRLAAV
ncbi:transketolase [Eilatimonas milleporae]|uniref:Pyruvate dehydrogenase E1 component n=1 Tax=Eilatimonas milleporae TaxID=911205 RepID=A0A3M0CGQ2_9PROT|nr:transketolase [Eilatimonas milleporae]RMB07700.1 pyruvate dehydrogenase E1 component [Eilatimonas milleporae]